MKTTAASQARWAIVLMAVLATHVAGSQIVSAQQAEKKQTPEPAAAPVKSAEAGAPLKVPPLDEFLERAMTGHPEIEAARAKVELAESELRQTQFRIARELMELRSAWEPLAQNVAHLEEGNKAGAIAFQDLVEARAKLAPLDAQIKALLRPKPSTLRIPATTAVPPKLEVPKGPLADRILSVLHEPVTIDFIDTPLTDALDYLSGEHKIKFMAVLRSVPPDLPVHLELKDIPLGAALQALEDVTHDVRFVLRDYAIVATDKDSPLFSNAVSAVKFWEESLGEHPKPAADKKP